MGEEQLKGALLLPSCCGAKGLAREFHLLKQDSAEGNGIALPTPSFFLIRALGERENPAWSLHPPSGGCSCSWESPGPLPCWERAQLCVMGAQGRKGRDRNGVPAAGFSLVSLSNPVSEISTTVKPVPTWKRLI